MTEDRSTKVKSQLWCFLHDELCLRQRHFWRIHQHIFEEVPFPLEGDGKHLSRLGWEPKDTSREPDSNQLPMDINIC
jgi:hypothetical protein